MIFKASSSNRNFNTEYYSYFAQFSKNSTFFIRSPPYEMYDLIKPNLCAYMQIFCCKFVYKSWKPFTSFHESNNSLTVCYFLYFVYSCKPLEHCDKTAECSQLYAYMNM